jgi:predicted amidohydrolase YtcJ
MACWKKSPQIKPSSSSWAGAGGIRAFAKAGTELWARFGYTTAQEGRAVPALTNIVREMVKTEPFKIDVVIFPDLVVDREFVKANVSSSYVNRVRVAGGKISIDGSPQGFTAWRDRPYYKPVGNYPAGYTGYTQIKQEDLNKLLDWAFENNIQTLTHCNGEAASDSFIAALDMATAKHGGGDRRHVLIHGQFLREDQVDSYKRLGVVPSLFPMHTFYWGDWHRDHTVGPVLAENISPTGWCVQRGMKFTSHHDAPVAFPDSMRVLDATVTRRSRSGDIIGPHQRVDVVTGLKSMTIWPAYQIFEEKTKGTIEVGKLSDFVVLDRDPLAIDPETIDTLKVMATYKEGTKIFELSAESQKRADLMLKPTKDGRDIFGRFLSAAAVRRDFERLPEAVQRRPMMQRALKNGSAGPIGPHEKACVLDLMSEWTSAMAEANQ